MVLAATISSVTAATLGELVNVRMLPMTCTTTRALVQFTPRPHSPGYDVGVMADAIVFIGNDMQLNSFQTQIIVGSLNFIAAFGTLIAGRCCVAASGRG